MSDALTDIARDQQRQKVVEKIRELEKEELTSETAQKLIELWRDYASIRGGYWTRSNQQLANEKIQKLEEWLEG